jgi:hypothetical protein
MLTFAEKYGKIIISNKHPEVPVSVHPFLMERLLVRIQLAAWQL